MKNDNFKEVQRFNHPVFIAGLALVSLYLFSNWMNVFYDKTLTQAQVIEQWVIFSITALVDVLFFISNLTTKINKEGISIKFSPFHLKYVTYKWEDITAVKIRKFNSLTEFGGWGIRLSISGHKCFNTRGNMGIEISLKNGKKRIIGTQKAEEVERLLAGRI